MILIHPHWQSNWVWSAGSLPFLGDDRRVTQPQVSQESSKGPALADTQQSPGPSLGQSGQSCWPITCWGPLAAGITAVGCSSQEGTEQMREWFPYTPWTWHRPSPNASAAANRRSAMKRVPHFSVNSVCVIPLTGLKSDLDFLDRQESCRWQIEEIICHQKHRSCIGVRGGIGVRMGLGVAETEEDSNKSSNTVLREDLFAML